MHDSESLIQKVIKGKLSSVLKKRVHDRPKLTSEVKYRTGGQIGHRHHWVSLLVLHKIEWWLKKKMSLFPSFLSKQCLIFPKVSNLMLNLRFLFQQRWTKIDFDLIFTCDHWFKAKTDRANFLQIPYFLKTTRMNDVTVFSYNAICQYSSINVIKTM